MTHPDSIPNFPPSLKKDHTKHLHIEYSCKWTESLSLCYYWTLLMINRTKRSLSVTATKLSPSFHYHFIAKPIIKRKLCLRNLLSKNWLDYLLENVLKIQSQIALEFIYGNNQYRAVCMEGCVCRFYRVPLNAILYMLNLDQCDFT